MSKKTIYKLNFAGEERTKRKRLRTFIASFAVFVVLFGAVSLFMFLRSVNFDPGSLFSGGTPVEETEPPTQDEIPDALKGKGNILLICTDSAGKPAFSGLLCADFDNRKVNAYLLPKAVLGSQAQSPLAQKAAVQDFAGITVDKYIRADEAGFKKIISYIGDITVEVPSSVRHSDAQYTLLLDKGKQSLTGDLFYKYMLYCGDSQSGAEALAAFTDTVLKETTEQKLDSFFNKIINSVETDISIVDYTNACDAIVAYSNFSDKAKTSAALLKEGISDETK